jgi:hypothetical protein
MPETSARRLRPPTGRSLAIKDPERNVRNPPTLSDLARACACFGLVAVIGVACLNPMPDEYPSSAGGANPVGAAGASTGMPPQQGGGAGGMSNAGGGAGAPVGAGGAGQAGQAQAGQAGAGSSVPDGGVPDAGAPDADSNTADEPDAGSGGP